MISEWTLKSACKHAGVPTAYTLLLLLPLSIQNTLGMLEWIYKLSLTSLIHKHTHMRWEMMIHTCAMQVELAVTFPGCLRVCNFRFLRGEIATTEMVKFLHTTVNVSQHFGSIRSLIRVWLHHFTLN